MKKLTSVCAVLSLVSVFVPSVSTFAQTPPPSPIVVISSDTFSPPPPDRVTLSIAQKNTSIASEIIIPPTGQNRVPILYFDARSDNGASSIEALTLKIKTEGRINLGTVRLYSGDGALLSLGAVTTNSDGTNSDGTLIVFGDFNFIESRGRSGLNIGIRRDQVKSFVVKADLLPSTADVSLQSFINTNIISLARTAAIFPNHAFFFSKDSSSTVTSPFASPRVRVVFRNATTLVNPEGTICFARDLAKGSTGEDVARLQRLLIRYGYLILPEGAPLGNFGERTRSALKAYQREAEITPANGHFDSGTRAAINHNGCATPSITVLFPNGGEVVDLSPDVPSSTLAVRWNSADLGQRTINIDLISSTNVAVRSIAQNASNTGSFEIGATGLYLNSLSMSNGRGSFRVRVSASDESASDASDQLFTILSSHATPLLRLTAPVDGARVAKNQPYTIRWTANNLPSGARIKMRLERHVGPALDQASEIFSRVTTDTSWVWGVGGRPIGNYALTIGCYLDSINDVCDPSNRSSNFDKVEFSIVPRDQADVPPPAPPTVRVLSPNGGETFTAGGTLTGSFIKTGLSVGATYEVALVGNGFDRDIGHGLITAGGEQPISVTIPGDVPALPNFYRLRLVVGCNGGLCVQDQSDRVFTVTTPSSQPSITVIYPNGGEEFIKGQTYTLSWTSNNLPGSVVDIYVLSSDGTVRGNIATNVANTGSYTWTVPQSQLEGAHRFYVSSGNISDQSNNIFEIWATSRRTTQPSITVIYPNGGEVLVIGSTVAVTATNLPSSDSQGSRYYFALYKYYVDRENEILGSLVPVVNTSGEPFLWDVGKYKKNNGQVSIAESGSRYKIGVMNPRVPGQAYDLSDNYFTINPAGVTPPGNQPPVISEVSGQTVLNVGQTGTWTVRASDPENGPLTYSVSWGDESAAAGLAAAPVFVQTATFTHSYSATGTYTPTVTIKDSGGLTAQTSVTVQVRIADSTVPLSVRVLQPNGGESVAKNSQMMVRWEASASVTALDIKLLRDGIIERTYSNVPLIGYYTLTAPSDLGDGNRFKISLIARGANNQSVTDQSDVTFSIVAANALSCSATTINGYTLPAKVHGTTASVTKDTPITNGIRTYSNTFTCLNGTFGALYAAGTEPSQISCYSGYTRSGNECVANSLQAQACSATTINSYSVPQKNSGEAAIVSRNVSISNGTRTLTTTFTCANGTFSAGSETVQVTCNSGYAESAGACVATQASPINVTAPNGGQTLLPGQTYRISWTGGGSTGNIEIKWLKFDSLGYSNGYGLVATLSQNTGFYDWTVPAISGSFPASPRYKIQVRRTDNSSIDKSDTYFTVSAPSADALQAPSTLTDAPESRAQMASVLGSLQEVLELLKEFAAAAR